MRPEDIRKLYHQEDAATATEASATEQSVRLDPAVARDMLAVLYSLSTEDASFAHLLKLFLEGTLMEMIHERAAQDDAFALQCGNLIADLMARMQPVQRAGSGRHKQTRAA